MKTCANPGFIFKALKHNWSWCECFKNIFPFITIATVSLSRAHWQNRISSVGLPIWLPFATNVHSWPSILCNATLSQATFANYTLIFTTFRAAHANGSSFLPTPTNHSLPFPLIPASDLVRFNIHLGRQISCLPVSFLLPNGKLHLIVQV